MHPTAIDPPVDLRESIRGWLGPRLLKSMLGFQLLPLCRQLRTEDKIVLHALVLLVSAGTTLFVRGASREKQIPRLSNHYSAPGWSSERGGFVTGNFATFHFQIPLFSNTTFPPGDSLA